MPDEAPILSPDQFEPFDCAGFRLVSATLQAMSRDVAEIKLCMANKDDMAKAQAAITKMYAVIYEGNGTPSIRSDLQSLHAHLQTIDMRLSREEMSTTKQTDSWSAVKASVLASLASSAVLFCGGAVLFWITNQ